MILNAVTTERGRDNLMLLSTNTPDQSQHLVDIWNLFKFDPKSQVHL